MHPYETALCLGVAAPLAMFVILAFGGARIGKPAAGWCAVLAVLGSLGLSIYVLSGWLGLSPAAQTELGTSAARWSWLTLPLGVHAIPVYFGVKLDSLTVVMYFMVTLVSTCIFIFSVGYMAGHSDEIGGRSKYHRFFAYLCLFEFSMLGLVISSSLVFLFAFWELVGLCSYLLIGFYFDRKYASDAAIKAFVVNRVGDFGFMLGLMLVVFYLGTVDLDEAAATFSRQFALLASGQGVFASSVSILGWQVSGLTIATLMGVGLFCGAIGKSAQFPLHVWLPDAMAGPTPVSALIHAATMVAAGVYLVARVFRLLTPDAQFVVALIGCITLTITALIAVVQTDIKKVLAYSTLSQLGYMIFGLGVGAWVGALFHLITHAFFKAMLFLGSGQVIEGCHHEQDIRKMGGLRKKMPVTCITFLIGVLAIAGFGIPGVHTTLFGRDIKLGLGGFHSKDEILAVAYERSYNWKARTGAPTKEEHADGVAAPVYLAAAGSAPGTEPGRAADPHGAASEGPAAAHAEGHGEHGDGAKAAIAAKVEPLPRLMFWLPIIIAYVTPFYMTRCWWLTFMGKPRDEHVYHHAHESPLMYVPLVILALGTFGSSYWLFRDQIAQAGLTAADAAAVVAIDGEAHHATATTLALTHTEPRNPHTVLIPVVGFSWLVGMGLAAALYAKGLGRAEAIRRAPLIRFAHMCLEKKLFFDHIYNAVFLQGTKWLLAGLSRAFDTWIIDALANLAGRCTVAVANFSGRVLDLGGVDGFIDGLADSAQKMGNVVRTPQTGRIRNYVLFGTAGAGLVLIAFLILALTANRPSVPTDLDDADFGGHITLTAGNAPDWPAQPGPDGDFAR